jgi:hypothetical protein
MLYEAADETPVTTANYLSLSSFGIHDGNGFPKPAYYALKSLMLLLNDSLPPYPAATADSYPLSELKKDRVVERKRRMIPPTPVFFFVVSENHVKDNKHWPQRWIV